MTLTAHEVFVSFGGHAVLTGVSLTMPLGSIAVIEGRNGSGKTTFLNVISGLVGEFSGDVSIGSTSVRGRHPALIARLGVSRVLQQPRLIPSATVLDNTVAGLSLKEFANPLTCLFRFRHCRHIQHAQNQKAFEILDALALRHRASHLAGTLSFGEIKLVALARALITGGSLLILDEILTGLGHAEKQRVIRLVQSVVTRGTTVLCVEHDSAGWRRAGARILRLDHGRLSEAPASAMRN